MGEQSAIASRRPDGAEQWLARVLVIDDDPGITDLVATVLRYEGFSVQVAATGREGLQATTSFRPHLLVLDVMLPDGDGFEIQQRLVAEGSDVPILFLTARDATEDKVRGLLDGADDYVTKPFSLEELVAASGRCSAATPTSSRGGWPWPIWRWTRIRTRSGAAAN